MLTTIYLISEWVIRLVMLPVAARRRRPSSAMAWLTIIFFQPWLGLVLYGLLGRRRLGKRRLRRYEQVSRAIGQIDRLAMQRDHVMQPAVDPDQRSLITITEDLSEMPILGGNFVELIKESDEAIDRLVTDIDAAEHHVHLQTYIYRNDETGRRVAAALVPAAERGVTCRLIVDAVGSRRMLRSLGAELRRRGVEVVAALSVNPVRRRLARIDIRNHRKLAVLDGRIGYAGSQNIINADYGHRDLAWHDIMVRLTGPAVLQLQLAFLEDWVYETDEWIDDEKLLPTPAVTGDVPIQVVPSGPIRVTSSLQDVVVEAMYIAHDHVILTTPYFVPDEPLMLAFRLAVMRGVKVELIVPRRADHPLVHAAGRAYFGELLEMGVHIYLHTEGLLHAKTMTVDDTLAMIGSANFDIRSFEVNFELNLLMYGPDSAGRLRYQQVEYRQQSQRLSGEAWRDRGKVASTLDDMAKLLSPLL